MAFGWRKNPTQQPFNQNLSIHVNQKNKDRRAGDRCRKEKVYGKVLQSKEKNKNEPVKSENSDVLWSKMCGFIREYEDFVA